MTIHTAVIAFGSNLVQPEQQVRRAIAAVRQLDGIHSLTASPLYRTAPVGYADQPDFINAVALVETAYQPLQLLHELQNIEQQFGRIRTFRNAPRTLDLDIIDFNGEPHDSPDLVLPHPRAHERSFVMQPLAAIAPQYRIGTHGNAAAIAAMLDSGGIVRLPE